MECLLRKCAVQQVWFAAIWLILLFMFQYQSVVWLRLGAVLLRFWRGKMHYAAE